MKTMMQNKLKRIAALFLVVAMCFGVVVPYSAASEEDIIYIRTADDLIELSENCSYDKWSVGLGTVDGQNADMLLLFQGYKCHGRHSFGCLLFF